MINIRKIKYNLILGVLIGLVLAQLVMIEGYAILTAKQKNAGIISADLPSDSIGYFKILALIIFLTTIAIFNTKRFRKINFNKISIYLVLKYLIITYIYIILKI